MEHQDFPSYIVEQRPDVLNSTLASYGYPEPQSPEEAYEAVNVLINEHGMDAIVLLAQKEAGNGDGGDEKGLDKIAQEIIKAYKKMPSWAQLLGWGVMGYAVINQFFKKD